MSKRKHDDTECRFVIERAANALRSAEASMLTAIDALTAEKPHVAAVLRHGANELTAALGSLDHAVDSARLVGSKLVVPTRDK